MRPVLTVFIDGLKPDSLKYMPFINTLKARMRVRTELGFSNPCHTSMYTGVYPSKHLHWFIWEYSPETSPYSWTRKLKLPENMYLKYACYRVTRLFNRSCTSFYSIPFMWHIPLKLWSYFDVSEKKFWTESHYVENYPSVFELLESHHVEYEIVGMVRKHAVAVESSRLIANYNSDEVKPWTYFFIGDIDPLSHRYGQDSIQTQERLKKIDNILEAKYRLFESRFGDFTFMLFSDHGHVQVEGRVNPCSIFESQGDRLDNYIYFMDINYLRFWFRNEEERKRVTDILSGIDDKGFILTEEHLRNYNTNMPDNRYGDLIFHLLPGYAFDQGQIVALGKQWTTRPVTIHGCLPDYPDSDGVFVSNKQIISDSHIKLEDVLPSILSLLDVEIPSHFDGKVIWA
ncbi:alkaline phosphatase family protein [Chloroflexota bacterium]